VLIERSMHPSWLSNSYLVADRAGGHAVVVDTGGPAEPLLEAVARLDLTVDHVLVTHHHHDHVAENEVWRERTGARVLCHPAEADLVADADDTIAGGARLTVGDLQIEALHVPGHTRGQLNFLIDGSHVFTGDTLFAGSVGGTRAPGHTTFADLRRSIMEVLMALPDETQVLPGHTEATTIGRERAENPFIRVWAGVSPEGTERCLALGEPAQLIVWADDYDGGHKAWVRFDADGEPVDDLVPGSRVERS
jgi:glyoxylase-like metal-dependent hydrolase (beta-lactamase superfamily II)